MTTDKWERFPLEELADSIDYGLTASAKNVLDGPKFLRITDIQNGNVDWAAVPSCDATDDDISKYSLRSGDIVFARTGATTGKSYLIRECPSRSTFASYLIRVRPGLRTEPRYLAHFFGTPDYWQQIQREAQGAGQPGVNGSKLKTLTVPLPPLAEQLRIAGILDKADAIRRKRSSITPQIHALTVSVFREMFGSSSKNERSWQTVRIDEAGEVQLGRQRSPDYQTGEHTRPYLRVANVFEDSLDLSDVLSMDFDPTDFERCQLKPGDILLNEGQSTELVGRPAMWNGEIPQCCFQNTLIRFRAKPDVTIPEYALAVFLDYLRSGAFARISSKTSSVAHLGASRFAGMPFPLPPLDLQSRFAETKKQIRRIVGNNERREQEENNLFHSLVQRAFRGEL
jgi:type I restriction enzyme S subunit